MGKLNISIQNFRTIERASIDVESVTVLTGVNASGKSTISRTMFYCGYYSNRYEELLQSTLSGPLVPAVQFIVSTSVVADDANLYRRMVLPPGQEYDERLLLEALARCRDIYDASPVSVLDRERLGKMLGRQVRSRKAFFGGLDEMEGSIKAAFAQYQTLAQRRLGSFLSNELCRQFRMPRTNLLDRITIREDGSVVVGGGRESVGLFTALDRVLYVDTPMLLSVFSDLNESEVEPLHWREILSAFAYDRADLASQSGAHVQGLMAEVSNLIGGAVKSVEDPAKISSLGRVVFEDSAGVRILLPEVATGMKSFIILQRLLQKGLLGDRTLLIVDEPEAHLHPQWVVEYARLLLEIHHALGTRFLVASHSPEFVESLANIATQYPGSHAPTFYLATPSKERAYMYSYEDTHGNIEPIFEVFNRPYDSMSRYIEKGYGGK